MIHRQHPVVVYTIYGCPHCKRAIQLLRRLGVPFKAKNIGNNADLAMSLYHETGYPAVPKVFVNGKFIGGADQLHELAESGQLFRAFEQ